MSLFVAPKDNNYPTYLRYENVANCCGAGWMCYFPEPPQHDQMNHFGHVVKKAGVLADDVVKTVQADLDIITKKAYSLTLIILTDKQKKYYDKLVQDKGFKPIMRNVYHTYAGHLLTLYAKPRYRKNKKGEYIDTLSGMTGTPEEFTDDYYGDDYNADEHDQD